MVRGAALPRSIAASALAFAAWVCLCAWWLDALSANSFITSVSHRPRPRPVLRHPSARPRGIAGRLATSQNAQAETDIGDSAAPEELVEDFYTVLGVAEDADAAALKAAYRRESRASHPDLARGSPAEVEAARLRFAAVGEAFRVLSNAELRQAYDLRGLAGLAEHEFNGERVIMPPPWRVRIGHTGHHFWRREEYFVGLVAETIHDLSFIDVRRAYAQATKEPPGTGQAILVEKCTEKRAKDIVEALQEFGLICLAEEIEEEDEQ